jgi:hypothetical protein
MLDDNMSAGRWRPAGFADYTAAVKARLRA